MFGGEDTAEGADEEDQASTKMSCGGRAVREPAADQGAERGAEEQGADVDSPR